MPKRPDPSAQMKGDQAVMTAEMAAEIATERAAAGVEAATTGGTAAALVLTATWTGQSIGGVPDLHFAVKYLGQPGFLGEGLARVLPVLLPQLGVIGFPGSAGAPTQAMPQTPSVTLPAEPAAAPSTITSEMIIAARAADIGFLDALADKLDERDIQDLANDCRREAARLRRVGRG